MQQQLADIAAQLEAARDRARLVGRNTPAEKWNKRAQPERWSVAECIAHLNLTARAYIPKLRTAFADGSLRTVKAPERYRHSFGGWVLSLFVGPEPKKWTRSRTIANFVPGGDLDRDTVLAEFDKLHGELVSLTLDADGRALHRMRITSAFNERLKYNAYSALVVAASHAHRHLWQAEHVWGGD